MRIAFLLIMAVISLAACQQAPKPVADAGVSSTNTDSTITRLQAIIKQETIDFYRKDLAAWSSHFAHTPSVYWICVEDEVTLRATGWDELNRFVGDWMKANPTPEPDSLLRKATTEDLRVELSNSIAFVRYKNNKIQPDGTTKLMLENRTLQLIDGAWKIVGMTSAPGYNTPKSEANIFVHTAAK